MPYLAVSLSMLIAGPALGSAIEGAPRLKTWVEWLVMGGLFGVILLHVLPEAVELAHFWVFPVVLVSVGLTLLLERWSKVTKGSTSLVLALGLLALGFHSALDGVALGGAGAAGASKTLAVLVVVHRLPTSMAIWWLMKRSMGKRWAAGVLAWDAVATVTGFVGGEALFASASPLVVGLLQAVIAGSLLHVAFHVRRHGHGAPAATLPSP